MNWAFFPVWVSAPAGYTLCTSSMSRWICLRTFFIFKRPTVFPNAGTVSYETWNTRDFDPFLVFLLPFYPLRHYLQSKDIHKKLKCLRFKIIDKKYLIIIKKKEKNKHQLYLQGRLEPAFCLTGVQRILQISWENFYCTYVCKRGTNWDTSDQIQLAIPGVRRDTNLPALSTLLRPLRYLLEMKSTIWIPCFVVVVFAADLSQTLSGRRARSDRRAAHPLCARSVCQGAAGRRGTRTAVSSSSSLCFTLSVCPPHLSDSPPPGGLC